MSAQISKIKERMLEFTQLFCIERNFFQRFVIIYRYIYFLHSDPITKGILQKIFDSTAKVIGTDTEECLNEEEFLDVKGEAIFSRQFWIYYTNLEVIYAKMKKMKSHELDESTEYDNLCRLFSKPYSREMLELSFKVINSEIFHELDREHFFGSEKAETWFDKKQSILYIKGKKVLINKQEKITNAHKLLHHIFITNTKNIEDDFYYAEIAEDEFDDVDYTTKSSSWKRYHRACEYVNQKANEQTGGDIHDFLVYNTGKRGKVSINKRYL
jgi:hypothetical protein